MRNRTRRHFRFIVIFFAVLIFLTACGGGVSDAAVDGQSAGSEKAAVDGQSAGSEKAAVDGQSTGSDKVNTAESGKAAGSYEVPDFKGAVYDSSSAEGNDEVGVDLSHKDDGYFGVYVDSDARIKIQVFKGDDTYTYDINQKTETIYPFQLGSGSYTIKIMKNVVDKKYSELYSTTADVNLSDEFGPFLRPSLYSNYSEKSKCVAKAAELAADAKDINDFITGVYTYVTKNVKYDKGKAKDVQAGAYASGYFPDPDATYESGKGICIDYAALAAAMLRSQGVPTKIIFGYVGENGDVYHAWNMYYTDEEGWVAVEFEVSKDDWNRLDLTFSASGTDSKYIGDGTNYMDVFLY